jgi:hypothetical protein
VLDYQYLILVTRCRKRSKKIFKLVVFGVWAAAFLIEIWGLGGIIAKHAVAGER